MSTKYFKIIFFAFQFLALIVLFVLSSLELFARYDVKINGTEGKAVVIYKGSKNWIEVQIFTGKNKNTAKIGQVFQTEHEQIQLGDIVDVFYSENYDDIVYFKSGDNSMHLLITELIYLFILLLILAFVIYKILLPNNSLKMMTKHFNSLLKNNFYYRL